jgi:Tol biopolymer transport system component
MKIRTLASTIAVSFATVSAPVLAQCNPTLTIQPAQTFPKLSGRMVYHTYTDYGDGSSNLYMVDFQKGGGVTQLNQANWGISDAMNAHFSPDGKRLAFMARYQGYWHVFQWRIGSGVAPQNLTLSMGATLRNEDPKWSADGKKIVFKASADVKIMNLAAYGANDNNVTVSNVVNVTTDGYANEDGMPYFTQGGKYVVFARGARETSDIFRIQVDPVSGSPVGQATPFAATPGISDYYPIARDYSSYYYTRWDNASSRTDQLFLKVPTVNDTPVALKLNYCYGNTSDAAPADEDFLIFSSTRSTPYFNLFIGDVGSGQVWNIAAANAGAKQKLGASYTTAR